MKLYQIKIGGELKLRLPPATAPLMEHREAVRALCLLYPSVSVEIIGMDVEDNAIIAQRKIKVLGV